MKLALEQPQRHIGLTKIPVITRKNGLGVQSLRVLLAKLASPPGNRSEK